MPNMLELAKTHLAEVSARADEAVMDADREYYGEMRDIWIILTALLTAVAAKEGPVL